MDGGKAVRCDANEWLPSKTKATAAKAPKAQARAEVETGSARRRCEDRRGAELLLKTLREGLEPVARPGACDGQRLPLLSRALDRYGVRAEYEKHKP